MAYELLSPVSAQSAGGYEVIQPANPNAGGAAPGYDIIKPEAPAPKQTKTINSLIEQYSAQYGIDSNFIRSIVAQESGFNPRAYNKSSGAAGIGQFMPATWAGVAKQLKEDVGSPYDVDTAIRRTAFHLADLKRKLGSEELAAAAYKSGEGSIRKAGGAVPNTYDPHVDEYTPDYVKKVMRWKSKFAAGKIPSAANMPVELPGAQAGSGYQIIAPELPDDEEYTGGGQLDPNVDQKGKLAKAKDSALKIAEALNAVNAGAWAGIGAAFGDESFKTLYRKYQEEGNPIALAAKQALREMGVENKWALMAAGLIGDIAGDPLTYVGIGALTKAGKAAQIAKGAEKIAGSGKKIAALNQQLAKLAPELRQLAPTMAEQAGKGQRALIGVFGVPWVKGEAVLGAFDKAGDVMRPALGLVNTGAKLKDPKARQLFNELTTESRALEGYFGDLLKDRLADMGRRMAKLPEDQQSLITNIAENQNLYEAAMRGMHGDVGYFAVQYSDHFQLLKGLKEGNPEALRAIGAENLAGKWEKSVPELGGNYQSLLQKYIKSNAKEYGSISDFVKGKLGAKMKLIDRSADQRIRTIEGAYNQAFKSKGNVDAAGKALEGTIEDVLYKGYNIYDETAKIDAAGMSKIENAFKNMNDKISTGTARDVAENRFTADIDDVAAWVSNAKNEAADKFENLLLDKLDQSARIRYNNSKMQLLEQAKKGMPRYVPHIVPKELQEAFKKNKGAGGAAEFSETVADEIARKLTDATGMPTYTIQDVNRFAGMSYDEMLRYGVPKETAARISKSVEGIKDLKNHKTLLPWIKKNPESADAFFSTNPGFIAKTAGERTARSISGSRFRNSIGEGFGISAEKFSANPEQYSDWVRIDKWKGTEEGKKFFSPEVAEEINRTEKAFFGNEETNKALKVFDAVQNYWKAWTLAPFPAYHHRNLLGAVWNNALAGQFNPKYYKIALDIQNAETMARGMFTPRQQMMKMLGQIPNEEALIAGNKKRGKELLKNIKLDNGMSGEEAVRLARQRGISGKTVYEEELITGAKPNKNILSTQGPVIRAGREIGGAIEDNVRLSHFMHRLDEGYDAAGAAGSVAKFQFDYSNITPFERNVLTRAMPFYRFTRFNTPLQLQKALEAPGAFAAVEKARRNINREQDLPPWKEALLQDYQAANIPVQIGTMDVNGKKLERLFTLGNWTPTHTVMMNLGHPMATIIALATPAIKEPLEQFANYDAYRKTPIVDPKRGTFKEPFLNVPIPSEIRHVVKNVRIMNEFDRLFGSFVNTVAKDKSNYVLKSGFKPDMVNQAARLISGVTLSPHDASESKKFKIMKLKMQMQEASGGYKSAARRGDKANMDAALVRVFEIRDEIVALAGIQNTDLDTSAQKANTPTK